MARSFTGSKGSLKIDGVKVAFVGSINVTEDNTLTDIDVLDQLEVAEHAETGHKVSFTCNLFKIEENGAEAIGLRGADVNTLLAQSEKTLEVYNREGDRVEYEMTGVKWEGGSGSLDARGVWQGTWNFKGRLGRGL